MENFPMMAHLAMTLILTLTSWLVDGSRVCKWSSQRSKLNRQMSAENEYHELEHQIIFFEKWIAKN